MIDSFPPDEYVLAAADLWRSGGLGHVTQSNVARSLGKSKGNVSYHYGAEDLVRAAAVHLVRSGRPMWGDIEFAVLSDLGDDPEVVDGTSRADEESLALAEAFVWLERHGVTPNV